MDKLVLAKYGVEPSIEICENNFFVLSIENKAFLFKTLLEFRAQLENGEEGGFNLLLNDKPLSIAKSAAIVFDFTDIDFNSKSITNLLIKKFSEFITSGEQLEKLTGLESIVLGMIDDFRDYSGLNIEGGTNLTGANLNKAFSLKISDNKQSLLERLCEYVNLLCDLKPLKLFILVFAGAFLSEQDIDSLYRHCSDYAVRLLLIGGELTKQPSKNERRLIIDRDFCTICQGDWGEQNKN